MKVKDLFAAYDQHITAIPNNATIFEQSGMVNESGKLDFGFFPLGSGILTDKSKIEEAEIETCQIMVLGNDFGTVDYVKTKCPNNREKDSNQTINNLLKLPLNKEMTFFTNFFMGLRTGEKMVGKKTIQSDYENLCLSFFETQLNLVKPKIVLCLGKEVENTLSKLYFKEKLNANDLELKSFVNTDGVKFVLIPHPSYAHINWKKDNMKEKIEMVVKEYPSVFSDFNA